MLLEENRAKVMRRQISMVQRAFAAYFEGNVRALKSVATELNDEMHSGETDEDSDPMSRAQDRRTPSYLEK